MFKNIGGKIKVLALVVFIAEAAVLAISGIAIMADAHYDDEMMTGLLTLVLGPVVAWVSSWLLYGFGELIEKVSMLNDVACMIRSEMKEKKQDN